MQPFPAMNPPLQSILAILMANILSALLIDKFWQFARKENAG